MQRLNKIGELFIFTHELAPSTLSIRTPSENSKGRPCNSSVTNGDAAPREPSDLSHVRQRIGYEATTMHKLQISQYLTPKSV